MIIEVFPLDGVDVIVCGLPTIEEAEAERLLWLTESDASADNVQVISYKE